MKTISKVLGLTVAAVALASTAASAGPVKHYEHGRKFTGHERGAIARSAAHLAHVKRQAWRDGRLSMYERAKIKVAERRHRALVVRAHRH